MRSKKPYCIALLLVVLTQWAQAQTIFYVTPSGAGLKNGSSWANAYDNTAFGLALQSAAFETDFWLSAGTYLPVCDISGNLSPADAREKCFSINSWSVVIYGGFAGTETTTGQRTRGTNRTILSGDIGVPGSIADNCYHVVNLDNLTAGAGIDGCTVSGGNANYDNQSTNADNYGGGIVVTFGQAGARPLSLINCIVEKNYCSVGGAGLEVSGSSLLLLNTTIANNTAGSGGATGSGGGVRLENGAQLTGSNSLFVNNAAKGSAGDAGGGLMLYTNGSSAVLNNCTFYGNSTASAIKPSGSAVSQAAGTRVVLYSTLLWGNDPVVAYNDGGTFNSSNSIVKGLYNSPSWLTGKLLFVNSADPAGADGIWASNDDGLQLIYCSPAINAGLTSHSVGFVGDITGATRIYNAAVDIGAYEFQFINPVVIPSVSIASSPGVICGDSAVTFTATPVGGGPAPTYQWTLNGMNVGTDNAVYVNTSPANGDQVSCTMTSNDPCAMLVAAGSNSITITIYPVPVITPGADKVIKQGERVQLAPQVTGNIASYTWTPATGLDNAAIPNPLAGPVVTTVYQLQVVSVDNCAATATITVRVLTAIRIPNVFSPNGDGVNDVWDIPQLADYPGCTVDVFNRYGQQVFHTTGYSRPWDGMYNGRPLLVGTYYYIIKPQNGLAPLRGSVSIVR